MHSGKGVFLILLAGVVGLSMELAGGFGTQNAVKKTLNPIVAGVPVAGQNSSGTKNLQLQTFSFTTPTPAPAGGKCKPDNSKSNGCTCVTYEKNGVVCENRGSDGKCPDQGFACDRYPGWKCDVNSCLYVDVYNANGYQKYKDQCSNHQICYGKPVIYLYPKTDMIVNVHLNIPGYVYISDPIFDTAVSGWNKVLAHSNGLLQYQGKKYHELYYESSVTKHVIPNTGVLIKQNELKEKLLIYTHQLGLWPKEQQEFLEYWLPKLQKLDSPYFLFSVLSPEQKEQVDHVMISPKPDTKIEFLAYFKPVAKPYVTQELLFPKYPPRRKGFTEIEWGGTIDY